MYCCRVRPMAVLIASHSQRRKKGSGGSGIKISGRGIKLETANTAVTISIEGNASSQIAD
jgi:hypothetical protein